MKLGLKVKHNEENLKFLKSELNAVEETCADLGSKMLNAFCAPHFQTFLLIKVLSDNCCLVCRPVASCVDHLNYSFNFVAVHSILKYLVA
jgi:hypothetical protein